MTMGRRKPINHAEARARGLLAEMDLGIHCFSNGTEYEGWASGNCWECWHWDEDTAGTRCAMECAMFLNEVSPALAQLFGWAERSWAWRYVSAEQRSIKVPSFTPPSVCPFFHRRLDDDGNDNPPPPDPDPQQLVLLADPTEDAALIQNAPSEAATPALVSVSAEGGR